MTLQELYQNIDGNYDQAIKVLRMDKLLDKHIRKLTKNGVVEQLVDAGQDMDPTRLFETAHAAKGVCANLGLVRLSEAASEIAEEFRPGNPRRFTDAEVKEKLAAIAAMYSKTAEGIQAYEES
ncbi:MAG: Hpt domain-containing protein [Candidatus Limivicinus sp.]|jgi:HPt (histidine-containing phosphotransfer) domain-containing protein